MDLIVNSVLCLKYVSDGNATVTEGQYLLTMHGRVIKRLTEEEYHSQRAYELRMFSGCWLILFLLPSVCFLVWQDDRRSPVRRMT